MADILTEAQRVLDEAQEAIAWIAFWKNGQSWNAVALWPEVDEGVPSWDATDVDILHHILKQDKNAIIVNAYYHNLGDVETMTRESLAAALRQQYEWQNSKISATLQNSKGDENMTFLQTAYGYDIYKLSADECKKNFRTFPLFCCFNAGTEPADRDLALTENEAETLEEMLDWCEKYSRNNVPAVPAKEPDAEIFPQFFKLYKVWALDENFDRIPLFGYITGEKLDAWLQRHCRDINEYGHVWRLDVSTASEAEAANIPKKAMHSIVKFEEIKPGDIFIPDGCTHKLTEAAAKQTYEAQVVVKITAENIENIVVSALECCSTYWVGVDNTTPEWADAPKDLPVSQYCAALLLAGKTVKLYDVEDDSETWVLTLEKLIKGIGREISNGFKLSDIEEEADAALQYALFDEVVYG